jgi:hypothetical protein
MSVDLSHNRDPVMRRDRHDLHAVVAFGRRKIPDGSPTEADATGSALQASVDSRYCPPSQEGIVSWPNPLRFGPDSLGITQQKTPDRSGVLNHLSDAAGLCRT